MDRRFPAPPSLSADAPPIVRATGPTLRWGIVATGSIAAKMAGELALLEDAELAAVCSRTQQAADDFAREHGITRAYGAADDVTGLERLAADPDVDVVYIGTPHSGHAADALTLIEAGKHVLCEKPFTVTAAEARELANAARANDVFLMEAVWTRFQPGSNRVWDVIADGAIGDVRWIRADLSFVADFPPEHRIWNRELAGGALLDLGPYTTLWPLSILGKPDRAVVVGTLNDDNVDTQEAITLAYDDGALAQLTSSLVAQGPRRLTVAGTEGWIDAGPSVTNVSEVTVHRSGEEPVTESFETVGKGYLGQLREVTRCVQEGLRESPTMPLADSIASMELYDKLRSQLGLRYPNDA